MRVAGTSEACVWEHAQTQSQADAIWKPRRGCFLLVSHLEVFQEELHVCLHLCIIHQNIALKEGKIKNKLPEVWPSPLKTWALRTPSPTRGDTLLPQSTVPWLSPEQPGRGHSSHRSPDTEYVFYVSSPMMSSNICLLQSITQKLKLLECSPLHEITWLELCQTF